VFVVLLGACGLALGVSLREFDMIGVLETGTAALTAVWGAILAVRVRRR